MTKLINADASRARTSPLALLSFAVAVSTMVACGGSEGPNPFAPVDPEIAFVSDPKVAFTNGGNAVIAYREDIARGAEKRARLRVGETFFDLGQSPVPNSQTRLPNGGHALAGDPSGTALSLHSSGLFDSPANSAPGFRGCRSTTAVPDWECSQILNGRERSTAIASAGYGLAVALIASYPTTSTSVLQSVRQGPELNWGAPQKIADLFPFNTEGSDPAVVYGSGLAGYAMYVDVDRQLVAHRYEGLFDRWEGRLVLAPPFGDKPVANARLVLHRDTPGAAAMALWLAVEPNSGPRIRLARYVRGWNFQPREVPGSDCASAMDAAMAANGEVQVVWRCTDETAQVGRIFASRYSNGAWSVTAQEIGQGDRLTPVKLAVDARGEAVAIWRSATELFHADLTQSVWQAAQSLGAITEGQYRDDFNVAMDDFGNGLAVWVRNVGTEAREGTRLAQQVVGAHAFTMTAPRYVFGGDTFQVTFRRGSVRAGSSFTLQTSIHFGYLLPRIVDFADGQLERTVQLTGPAVPAFFDGEIVARSEGATHRQTVTLMPEPSAVFLDVTPPSVRGGETATLNLRVLPNYPTKLDVQLASSNAVAPVPAQVSTGLTTSTAAVPVTTLTTTTVQTANFTASLRGRTATGSLTVIPATGQALLTVQTGFQGGTVTSTPAGINCNPTCTASYPIGTPVTLSPAPTSGYRFFAWEGDPDCSDGVLSMIAARTCRAIFLVADPPYPGGTGWTTIGRSGFLDLNYVNPSPALALEGVVPIVAHLAKNTPTGVSQVYVQRLQGNGIFTPIGFFGDSLNIDKQKDASEPAIVATANGLPYAAWIEGSGAQQNLYVSRLMLAGWASVGPLNTPLNYVAGSRASSPSIALDAELNPMVAWIEDGAVKFKRFDGTAWVQVQGGEGPPSALADRVRLSSFAGGAPVIAWMQGSGASRALKVVREFAFTALGTQVNGPSFSLPAEFGVLGEANGAIVSWGEYQVNSGQLNFYVRSQRWNNLAWVDVASNQVVSNNPNSLVSIAMPRNASTVAYTEASRSVDISTLGVSSVNSLGNWGLIAPPLPGTRETNIGPTPVELANVDSPIVVRVERNALNEYIWWTLRYYRP